MTGVQSPNGLKDSGTLFNVTEGLKRDGNLVHTKIAFFRLIKDQVDSDASLLVGRHTVICPYKGLFLLQAASQIVSSAAPSVPAQGCQICQTHSLVPGSHLLCLGVISYAWRQGWVSQYRQRGQCAWWVFLSWLVAEWQRYSYIISLSLLLLFPELDFTLSSWGSCPGRPWWVGGWFYCNHSNQGSSCW